MVRRRKNSVVSKVKGAANGVCQKCRKNVGARNLDSHHIIPLSCGGRDTINNSIALCNVCHRREHGSGWKQKGKMEKATNTEIIEKVYAKWPNFNKLTKAQQASVLSNYKTKKR